MNTPPASLASGAWGGEQVVLEVAADKAVLRLGCARGELPAPVRLDAAGRFSAQGELTEFRGGPSTAEERPRKADYHGTVNGDRLTLTVRYGASSQTYQLMHGQRSKVIGCY